MSVATLEKKLAQLPEEKQKEVQDFIDFLLSQGKTEMKETQKPMFGALKGKIRIADDFDEPLEDFKDYM